MKKILLFALCSLLIASLLLPALATQSAITDVKATAFSATQVKVSWQGAAPPYHVYYMPVKGTFPYFVEVYETSVILNVAPETTYMISVSEGPSGDETEAVYVTTPRISPTREYNYKYQSFTMFYVNANTNLDFFEDNSRTSFERISGPTLASAGELRNFNAVAQFTLSSAKYDKELNYVIVLYPPNSNDRYLDSGTVSIPASWTSLRYAFGLNQMIQGYLQKNDSFAKGRYAIELYFNGWLGGKTTFIVE